MNNSNKMKSNVKFSIKNIFLSPINHSKLMLKLIISGIITIVILCTLKMSKNNNSTNISIPNNVRVLITEPTIAYPNYSKQELEAIDGKKRCYQLQDPIENLQLLNDIDDMSPQPDKNIFFLSTTCCYSSRVTLNRRYFLYFTTFLILKWNVCLFFLLQIRLCD